jgi:hypothetical protein
MPEKNNPGLWDRLNNRVRRDFRNTPLGDLYRLLKKPAHTPQTTQQNSSPSNSSPSNTSQPVKPQRQDNVRPAQSQRQQGNYPIQTTLPERPSSKPVNPDFLVNPFSTQPDKPAEKPPSKPVNPDFLVNPFSTQPDKPTENPSAKPVNPDFLVNPFGAPSSRVLEINNSPEEVSFGDKLVRAIALSVGTGVLKKEFLESMQKILTPESLATIGGLLAVVGSANIAAAAFGGPIGAGISTAVSGAMATLVVGGNITTLVQATGPLFGFLTKAYGATTEAEFLAAANDFAKFVNVVGPDVVLNMTGAKAGQALGAISGKLASLGSELAGLSPARQKQIRNGLESGRKLLDSLGENIQGGFKNIFNSIDDALKHLSGEKKAANNLAAGGDGKLPSGNGKKPGKPTEAPQAEFPAGSPIKAKPAQNPALKTSTDMQDWIILNIDKRLAEKQAALNKLAKAKASGKSTTEEIEKINKKIGQADDALVNAGATWKLAEEGVNIIEFEKKVPRLNKPGAAAEADIGGQRWWVETGNGTQGKLDQIIKALSNAEANKDRKSLIAYIPKFSEAAFKQIIDAGGYVAKDYKELSRLVKQAEKGELAALNSASSLGRQFKAVLKKDKTSATLPFDFNTLDSALTKAVNLDGGKSGIKYGYIITKQDSKILIPGKSKATVLPIPGRDNQGVIVKFTPTGRNGNPPYTVELMTGRVAPEGLVSKLITDLNLNKIFLQEMKNQSNIPKGIHNYEGVITRDKGSISEGLNKEVYTAQVQLSDLEQPSVAEQLRAKMNEQKLALDWIDNEPSKKATILSNSSVTQNINVLASGLDRQNRLKQALVNQNVELESGAQAQIAARAAERSVENNRPKQNQREM